MDHSLQPRTGTLDYSAILFRLPFLFFCYLAEVRFCLIVYVLGDGVKQAEWFLELLPCVWQGDSTREGLPNLLELLHYSSTKWVGLLVASKNHVRIVLEELPEDRWGYEV